MTNGEKLKEIFPYLESDETDLVKVINIDNLKSWWNAEYKEPFKPMVEIDLDYVIKQKYIERGVLDKIRAEISCNIIEDDTSGNTPAKLRADWAAANKAHMIDIAILDKYREEVR